MLTDTLNTNQVKNSAGIEVEFNHLRANDRERVFYQIGESPALQHRLSIKHQETGAGLKNRRRSVVRVDKTTMSGIDPTVPITTSAYIVLDIPIGASSTTAEAANVLAELVSFVASLGADSTILHNGTGNGASVLLNGGL